MILKTLISILWCVWLGLELNSTGKWISRAKFEDPWFRWIVHPKITIHLTIYTCVYMCTVKKINVCFNDGLTSFGCVPIIDLPWEVECGNEPQRGEHQVDHQQHTARSCKHTFRISSNVTVSMKHTMGSIMEISIQHHKVFFLSLCVCATGLT